MRDRSSSLFGRLTLRSKRQTANSSSSSNHSTSSAITTPETETPASFSGPADYGLGYSSINHERSSSYNGKRTSQAALSRPIEFDRYAEPSSSQSQTSTQTQKHKGLRSNTIGRYNRLSTVHAEEDPLFVEIVHEAAPAPTIQSTVRAQSSSGSSTRTLSPQLSAAAFDTPRPQSPFAITSAASQSRLGRPPSRVIPRRCHSADDSEGIRASPSTVKALSDVAGAPAESVFAVGRGWKKGVYTTKDEAQRQIRNVSIH